MDVYAALSKWRGRLNGRTRGDVSAESFVREEENAVCTSLSPLHLFVGFTRTWLFVACSSNEASCLQARECVPLVASRVPKDHLSVFPGELGRVGVHRRYEAIALVLKVPY